MEKETREDYDTYAHTLFSLLLLEAYHTKLGWPIAFSDLLLVNTYWAFV